MTGTQATILLVEDNPDDEMLARRAFRDFDSFNDVVGADNSGHSMSVARDGLEAIRQATDGIPPALVLLDLNLPGVDGFEVLKAIRKHAPTASTPVVVLTSSSNSDDITRAYSLGANSYITKPVDYVRFTEVVRELSEYWLLFNGDAQSAASSKANPPILE